MVSSTLSETFLNLLTYFGGGPRCSGRRGSAATGATGATVAEAKGATEAKGTAEAKGATEAKGAIEAAEGTGATEDMGRAWGFPYPARPVSR